MALLSGRLSAQEYVFHGYRQDSGLSNIAIHTVQFDRAGFVWVATENGVYRLQGSRLVRFGAQEGLPEHLVVDLFIDPAGVVWAGTYQNLYRWNGHEFRPAFSVPFPIWGNQRIAAEGTSHLLAVRQEKLYRIDPRDSLHSGLEHPVFTDAEIEDHSVLKSISTIVATADGDIWMGCEREICHYRNGRLTEWAEAAGVPHEPWQTLYFDRHGSLWASGEHHLLELSPGGTRFLDRTPPSTQKDNIYTEFPISEDRMGRILVAMDEGIARWDGKAWSIIYAKNDLHFGRITGIAFDGNGDPWIGTGDRGLIHWIGYRDWEGWTDLQGLPSSTVWSVDAKNMEQTLVGTNKGPARIDIRNHSVTRLSAASRWDYGQVSGISEDRNGKIWATTFSGSVLRVDSRTGKTDRIGKIDAPFFGLQEDAAGRLWLKSDQKGLYLLDPTRNANPRILPVPEADAVLGSASSVSASCVAPDGSIWFATDDRLLQLQNGRWRIPKFRGNGLLKDTVLNSIACARDGSLWATAEQSGPWHIQSQGKDLTATLLPMPAQWSQSTLTAISLDHYGWMWLGTDQGLLAWNGSEWRLFNQESGLLWNDISENGLVEGSDGSLWIGTSAGVSRLIHPERAFDRIPLHVSITGIQRGAAVFEPGQRIDLPWAGPPLRLAFAAPAMWNQSDLVYHYRVNGLNSSWVTTHEDETVLSSLPSGEYKFEVYATNAGLHAVSPITSVEFHLRPPWWKTFPFMTLWVLLGVRLLMLVLHLRTKRLLAQRSKLEALVRERTSALEASQESLSLLATRDYLTGLPNRRAMHESLQKELQRARRTKTSLMVILADIDYFKQINDTYGHLAGDEALRQFAQALACTARSHDHVGRYGGEEFLILLRTFPIESAQTRLLDLHAAITNLSISYEGHTFSITCSLGASIIDGRNLGSGQTEDPNALLSSADQALYQAKRSGRNRAVLQDFSSDSLDI
ncbi:ligand-binding sensor domain-containing diguanylate cyclase [Granulicella arctica]|uniref:diguanylate cyclase n=1 Tax=Granulicella arctica TaxID=940613 RepID=A0A7Y9PEE5_9BACT|nr:ligand-binding sensor domain-containing diguanylate cyclase [Granulicella arctica]NYF78164.1 diguanylate cyclase (GGDEF)-like protein [Granulicella arctica]